MRAPYRCRLTGVAAAIAIGARGELVEQRGRTRGNRGHRSETGGAAAESTDRD